VHAPATVQAAPGITLDGICLDFEGRPLFSDLSLTLRGARTSCILGPSGCGKSTLLKLMAGAPNLDFSGQIRFDSGGKTSGQVAWMSQNDLLLPWLPLLDNVLLGARLRGELSPEKRAKALELAWPDTRTSCPPPCPAACASAERSCALSWKSVPSFSWTNPFPPWTP
jgi:putative hydroxymethylpyrimidine transport system ATP-binding protein